MRKVLLIIAVVILAVSCQTTISVPYMRPAAVDMGSYRNLAVASVIPYRPFQTPPMWVASADSHSFGFHIRPGYTASTAANVASYATGELYSSLSSTGFFNLLPPSVTDSVLDLGRYGADISREFRARGYDAVLIPRITSMTVNESIYSVPDYELWTDADGYEHRKVVFDYYYKQVAAIEYTLTVIDTHTGSIIARRAFSDTEEREGSLDQAWSRLDDISYLYRRMIRSFTSEIIRYFVPTHAVYDVTLMDNKPENSHAEEGYERAENGDIIGSRDIFISVWEESPHLPSGYNAALLYAASGDFDSALDLLDSVMARYSNKDVRSLYRDLQTIRSRNTQAMSQVNGTGTFVYPESSDSNSIYGFVMGL